MRERPLIRAESSLFLLKLEPKMSEQEITDALSNAKNYIDYLKRQNKINPLITEVLAKTIEYASANFTGLLNRMVVNNDRYEQVNRIFILGIRSTQSLEDEKKFFERTRQLLCHISDKKSKLKDNCMFLTLYNERRLVQQLEDSEPSHRNAVDGISSASFLIATLLFFATRIPVYSLVFVVLGCAKFLKDENAPSPLGHMVYYDANIRQFGLRMFRTLPVNLPGKLGNLLERGSVVAVKAADRLITAADRILDPQREARQNIESSHDEATLSYEERKKASQGIVKQR